MIHRLPRLILVLAALLLAAAAHAAPATHELLLTIDPQRGDLHGRDRIVLPPGQRGRVQLELGEGLQVERLTANGAPLRFMREGERLSVELPAGATRLELHYGGRLDGSEPPRLKPEGSWLPGEFAWYPRFGEADRLEVTVLAPRGQLPVLTGELVHERIGEDGVRATFRAYPDEPPSLFAGPYVVEERIHRGLRLRAYFHEEERRLAPAYLDDVAVHVDRFASIIGPYPYRGFAVVSAPHPVGLGYPGLTYVSRKILPLPFMRARSLPHEILHAWWGNAVRVAGGSGNWAEGLTTYMSDYRLSGPAERERMRREWLRDHAALPAADDQALSRFVGKLHARDQVVGYGKGAFVFHMLEQRLGERAFESGLRRFYASRRGQAAGWDDLRRAFEEAVGERLEGFFGQWVDRAGAAELALGEVAFEEDGVRLTLVQKGAPYRLRVPVAIDTAQGRETRVLELAEAARSVQLRTSARPVGLQVDPEHHLFRRLVAGETVPVLRDLTLLPQAQTVLVELPQEAGEPARRLARQLLQSAAAPVPVDAWQRESPALAIGIGTPQAVAAALGLPAPQWPPGTASAVVWAAPGAHAPTVVVAAQDPGALESLIRPLPHYAGESWLRFQQGRVVERGLWPTAPDNALSARR
ncbi:M1 family metallopeptidase [Caldimonas tepidiphila]|uniref:M1 family metallopeptidase n=1 Tax=Caldimonas tepidiphila TaxID=2315841 RepID=UPI000E5B5334|nr:M1 family aminopeptidase [Caldimonas tepidiphila]